MHGQNHIKSGARVYVKVEAMDRNPLIPIIFVILAVEFAQRIKVSTGNDVSSCIIDCDMCHSTVVTSAG
jgi:hypothetical protein